MRGRRGFSLIELLVVVAIMGTITVMGTVSYVGYKSRARNTVALSDAIKLSVAEESFYSAELRYIPNDAGLCNNLCVYGFMLSYSPPNWTTFTNYAVGANNASWSAQFAHRNGSLMYNAASGKSSPTNTNCPSNVCPNPNLCIPPNNNCCCPNAPSCNPCF